ncbi:fatty acid desaturase [Streptomyces achromogenes]|uniref:Fatty acid desaturase n=1 Tax=Streptomyces achromogenes TaxID=67255 RepID=A0ABU0Q197_STRAH|nr:fatty acid desaturase [Streptomyces achromogenes]MDQ0831613.1 fatty acid desaturase [Streptomyces achromogenes]
MAVTPPPLRCRALPCHGVRSAWQGARRKIADAGLLRRRPGYYALRITVVTALYVSGWAAVALIGDSRWTLTVAGFLAVVFGQVALIAHDAAHRQVFRRRRAVGDPARRYKMVVDSSSDEGLAGIQPA